LEESDGLLFNWSYFGGFFNFYSSLDYGLVSFDFISSFSFVVSSNCLNGFWGNSWDFNFYCDIFKKVGDVWV
jgi:hypothetical protein